MTTFRFKGAYIHDDSGTSGGQRKLCYFVMYLASYALGMLILVPYNLMIYLESTWALLPMLGGGGSVLALHVAYITGLFDIFKKVDE